MKGTIGVPHAVVVVICARGVSSRVIASIAWIAAIDIVELAREERSMIERSIEIGEQLRVIALYFDSRESLLPCCLKIASYLVEIAVGTFCQ